MIDLINKDLKSEIYFHHGEPRLRGMLNLTMVMKNTLFIAFVSVILASCGEKEVTEQEQQENLKTITADCDCSSIDFKRNAFGEIIKGSLVYDIKSKEIFSGTCEEKFGDGTRKEIRQYSQGKLHGTIATWDENGILRRKLKYNNGIQDGYQVVWNQLGDTLIFEHFTKGEHGQRGFKYDKENLNFIWFNKERTTDAITFYNPNSYSIVIQKTLFSDEKNPKYEIYINDSLSNSEIKEFVSSVIKNHFSKVGKVFVLNTDYVRGDANQPDINIGYIEDKGWLTKLAKQKEKEERFRIYSNIESLFQSENAPNEVIKPNSQMVQFKINDPDGYSNLRKTPNGDILQKVYENERFEVLSTDNQYKKVKLSDGTIGFIHESRVIEAK